VGSTIERVFAGVNRVEAGPVTHGSRADLDMNEVAVFLQIRLKPISSPYEDA